ncbi:MAG: hypothetical protein DI598_14195 [Pseudopedobacter saltans]|uniref:Uncharacterized protein n=1 Tax=Pseudopedobacter saltans TaxID=151895 RepID=A0A2W5EQC9_9SPHI|nr:MAG: hypothetical protein DI598_14195 [Pseudopedobacter saltans]
MNGIAIFKFGENISKFNKDLKLSMKGYGDNCNYYRYKGNQLNTLFKVPVKEVKLGYYKNRLWFISIDFDSSIIGDNGNKYLISRLDGILGKGSFSYSSDNGKDWSEQWSTSKNVLQICKYKADLSNGQAPNTQIFLINKSLYEEYKLDAF